VLRPTLRAAPSVTIVVAGPMSIFAGRRLTVQDAAPWKRLVPTVAQRADVRSGYCKGSGGFNAFNHNQAKLKPHLSFGHVETTSSKKSPGFLMARTFQDVQTPCCRSGPRWRGLLQKPGPWPGSQGIRRKACRRRNHRAIVRLVAGQAPIADAVRAAAECGPC